MSKWTNFQPAKVGVVLQSRPAETKFQISLNKGESVQVLAEFNGWYKVELRRPRRSRVSEWKLAAYSRIAKRSHDLIDRGIFPSALVQIVDQGQTPNSVKVPGYSHTLDEYTESSSQTLAVEIIQVLKEWSTELQKLYNSQSRKEFQLVKKNMAILVGLRKTILDPHFQKEASKKEKQEIGDRILKVIEEGSRQLNLDMMIRVAKGEQKGNRANENNTDILSLYKSYRDLYAREVELKRRAKMAQRNKNNQNSSKRRKKGGRGQEEENSNQEEVQRNDLLREVYDLPEGNVQMLLDIKAALFQVGEPTELYFQLWSHNLKKFVSEEYMIELSTFGLPKDERLIQNMKAVFREITENEYLEDLFLICRIYRKGKLLWEPSNAPPSSSYLQNKGQAETEGFRRPFGISVLPLTPNIIAENLRNSVEYSPGNLAIFSATQETLFSTLHEQIINNTGVGYERAPTSKAIGIAVGITMFEGPYEEVLEEFKKQVDLSGICSVNMLSFPTVIPPGEMRNDLYISLVNGQIQSGSSQVEARVFVGDDSNASPCISRFVCTYSEPKKQFVSSVYMNSANPSWNEMFRINLPPAEIEQSSIGILVGTCQGKKTKTEYYACGVFDIVDEDGVVKKDGTYTVELYKYVKDMEKNLIKTLKDKSKLQPLKNNTLTLKLNAVSTQVTQDSHLSQLLHWKEASKKLALNKIIDQSTFVSNQQIFQFIRVMFDSLFSIATSNENETILNLVYKAILHVVDALSKKSFMQYQTVVDEYIAKWFHFPTSYKWLTASLLKSLQFDDQNDKRGLKSVGESLKSFHYLFRFILVSRFEFEEKSADQAAQDKAQFLEDARNCFVQFNKIMSIQNVNLIAAQDSTLKLIASLFEFDKILTLFATEETAQITKALIENIPTTGRKNTTEGKLTILNSIVRGQLGKNYVSRRVILPTLVKNLKVHFNQSATERRLCIGILSELLSTLEKNLLAKEEQEDSVQETYNALIILYEDIASSQDALKQERDDIAKKAIKAEKELSQMKEPRFKNLAIELENELDLLAEDLLKVEQVRGLLIASGLSMLRFTTVEMLNDYLQDNPTKLLTLLRFIETSMSNSPYPTFWISWNSFQFWVFLSSLQTIGNYLSTYANGSKFNVSFWNGFFHNCVQFILAERLQLENFSTSKQSKITADHGDMRITMSEMIYNYFQTLDKQQIHFVPSLVSAVLRYANMEKREISINGLNVYYCLLEREFKTNGTMKQCEGATVGMLDEYLNAEGMDDLFKDLFVQTLEDRFRKDSAIEKEGMRFLYQTKEFMEMITAVQRFSDAQEDEKTFALLRVIDSVLSSNREELYFKYIHMLSQIHATNKNFVEAGLCLLLHANRLSFQSETLLPAINNDYPEEIERVRKEKLYTKAIHYLDEGRDWERAITLIRELCPLYETVTFEYKKMSELIRREGSLYEKIYDQKRLFASYFYVAYYGKGFREMGLQNKEFIYKGKEAERLPDFIERIVKKFPNSELLKTIDKPPKEITESEGQHIQIMTVYPCFYEDITNKLAPRARNPKLPFNILSYSLNSQVKVFYFTKTYRKNPKDKSMNEMRDLYTNINFLTISPSDDSYLQKCPKNKQDIEKSLQCFPSIIRRKEIQSYIDVTLSPVENAVKNLEDKNCELEELIIDHALSAKPDTQKLSMLLNGMIDAAVNGGINRYIDAFFSGDYLEGNPAELEPLKRFTKALGLQPTLLEKGLQCYKQFGKATTKAHSEHLENLHIQMKEQLKNFFANNKLE